MTKTRIGGQPPAPSSASDPNAPAAPAAAASRRWPWAVAAAATLALAAAGAWWYAGGRPQTAGGVAMGALPDGVARDALNLVVITLDTTRADHLGAYGSRDVKTPAIDALARDGVLFEQTMTAAPLTLPAHASIFTGRFPPEHGVRDNGGFYVTPDQLLLAEVLKARGYRTGGFIAAYVLDGKWGMDQGFETYVDDFDVTKVRGKSAGDIQRPGNEVVDKALPWIDTVKGERFFAWIHLYDPHTPYAPPEPFKSEYAGRPYRGEVAFTDAQVGRVIEHLRQAGLLDRTIVAVMGDHGESLGDHGEDAHGFFIYESAARVPFIVRAPFEGTRGRRVADPVRIVDLMPTALELLGVPVPPGLSGATLVPLMTGATLELGLEGYAEAMYPLHHYGWSELRAIRSGRFKAIDAPRPELYDLAQDPAELKNIIAERRTVADQMIARLRQMEQAFSKAAPVQSAVDVDPEVRARLAALGYVGSFVASAGDARTDRADPKDKIHLFNKLSLARDLSAEKGSFPRVAAVFEAVLREDPNVIDAWFSYGNLFFREKRYREAIDRFKRALELKPDYDLAVINMAEAYRHLGDDDAALAGFERYLQIDPRDPYVRYQRGEIFLDRGDLARAEQEFRAALSVDANVAEAKNALGVIAFQRGDLDGAEALAHAALAAKADVRLAHYNLALIAEKRGDLRLAEKEYLLELEQHPNAFKAAFNLSRLYAQIGEPALEVEALRQAVDGNPEFAQGWAFLAQAYVQQRRSPAEAERFARKALSLQPRAEVRELAQAVLAAIRRG